MPTLSERILSRAAGRSLRAGEYALVSPDGCFTPDDAIATIIDYLEQHGVSRLHDPSKAGIFYDHYAPAVDVASALAHWKGREFARTQGITRFYDVGSGISHQLCVEQGIARPGQLVFNADSHTCTLGAAAAFGTGLGASEIAYAWATGNIWVKVPQTVRIRLSGALRPGVSAKDLCLYLLRHHGARCATYQAIEFHGPAAAGLSMEARMTLCNMGVELGAKAAMFPYDDVTAAHFNALNLPVDAEWGNMDEHADYVVTIDVSLDDVPALVAEPPTVDRVRPLDELRGTVVHQAFLGTCTNGRLSDLREAADVLRGRRVAQTVRMIVAPASAQVYAAALDEGLVAVFVQAGCTMLPPGCGPCAGLHQGLLAPEEVCVSSGSRNFTGRMGSASSRIYLASPAVVAASAVVGSLTAPDELSP